MAHFLRADIRILARLIFNGGDMSFSKHCKQYGLKGAQDLASRSGESIRTLRNWYDSDNKQHQRRLELVIKAVLFEEVFSVLKLVNGGVKARS